MTNLLRLEENDFHAGRGECVGGGAASQAAPDDDYVSSQRTAMAGVRRHSGFRERVDPG